MDCGPAPERLRRPTGGGLPIDVYLRPECYRYDILLDGDVIVHGSRNPEHDAARALHARGLRGQFRTIDFTTGQPRMILDIEKTARLRTVERNDTGLVVVRYRPMSADVRAVLGTHTSGQGRVAPGEAVLGASQAAETTGGETCAASRRIPEPA